MAPPLNPKQFGEYTLHPSLSPEMFARIQAHLGGGYNKHVVKGFPSVLPYSSKEMTRDDIRAVQTHSGYGNNN